MYTTIHEPFLPRDDPDASLAFYHDRSEVVPMSSFPCRPGPIDKDVKAKSPFGEIGLSISGLPARL
jgi:hypothetical protein